MPKYGSASALFLMGGYDFLAPKLKTLALKVMSDMELTDGCGDVPEINTPTGRLRFSVRQGGGYFDTTAGSVHTAMSSGQPTTPQATPRNGIAGCMGNSVGAVCWGLSGVFNNEYEVLGDNGKLGKANVASVVSGLFERGLLVQPLAQKNADWNTKSLGTVVDFTLDPSQRTIAIASATKANPCVVTTAVPHGLSGSGNKILIAGNSFTGTVINGERTIIVITATTFSVGVDTTGSAGAGSGGTFVRSNSINGASGYQQIIEFSGPSGFVGKLRSSADDTTYADLITFANAAAAPNDQRLTASGVIDRYTSYDGDVTGGGTLTVASMIARS